MSRAKVSRTDKKLPSRRKSLSRDAAKTDKLIRSLMGRYKDTPEMVEDREREHRVEKNLWGRTAPLKDASKS